MQTVIVTFLITTFIILAALCMLGISKLITGKSRLRVGMCGKNPDQKQDPDKGCGTKMKCGLCGREGDEEE